MEEVLIDRTIEDAFGQYATGLPAGLSDVAMREIRSAFFAGVHVMFYSHRTMDTWAPKDVTIQRRNIELELMIFASQLPGVEGHVIDLPKC